MIGVFDISHLNVKSMNLGVIIGGLIFGVAFGAIGSNGIKKAISAVLGGLLGAFAFTMSYGYLKGIGLFEVLNMGKITLFNISEKYHSVFNIGFIGLLFTGLLFMGVAYILPKQIIKE